ncbi:proline-rich protein 5 [Anabrus simplex]|uniref:proline-rich protein 5 n=1 Tax=Anabrus simplex TaxID=316456 RepID=UPI0035A38BEE
MSIRLEKLRRIPSFNISRRENGLKFVDPLFRFSLTRLVEAASTSEQQASPGTEARFAAGWDQQFREEWGRLRTAVHELFSCKTNQRNGIPTFNRGHLQVLHDDVHVLQRSQAGTFIFEYYQKNLLPSTMELLLDRILVGEDDVVVNLSATWTHFYCHILPALEAIFVQVKNHKMTIRQATLLAFRDHVLLKLEKTLNPLLSELREEGAIPPPIKQMLLVLQGVCECYPPSDEKLRLEGLVARVVSPYLGYRGLYEGGYPEPILPSKELEVAHLRRPSIVDPRRLQRPLSVSSSNHLETLSDLFALSADRMFHRKTVHRQHTTTVW